MRDIRDFEGKYAITEDGKIWSYRRNKFLKPNIRSDGYLAVFLSDKGSTKWFTIHQLVARTYIPNPDSLPCVNHKDENPANNSVDNLEWCTYKYNNNYGNHNRNCGKAHGRKVYCIELDKTFDSCADAARYFNLSSTYIWYKCRDRKNFIFLDELDAFLNRG